MATLRADALVRPAVTALTRDRALAFAVWGFFLTLPVERVFTVDVLGFTVRPAYVFMAVFLLLSSRELAGGLRAMPTAVLVALAVLVSLVGTFSLRLSLGYTVWAFFVIAFALAAVGWLRADERRLRGWSDVYVVTGGLWGAAAIVQWLASYAFPDLAYAWLGPSIPRVHALTYEPSYFAFYLVPPLVLAVATGRARWGVPVLAALILSTSRTGLLGAVVAGVALLALGDRAVRRKVLAGLAVAALVLGMQQLPVVFGYDHRTQEETRRQAERDTRTGDYGDFVVSGVTAEDQTSALPRLETWKLAWREFGDRPLTGVGINAFGAALHAEGERLHRPASELKTSSLWLETMAEMGVVGLAALLAWAFLPIPAVLRLRRRAPIAVGVASAVAASLLMFALVQTWWVPYHWTPWIFAYALAAAAVRPR